MQSDAPLSTSNPLRDAPGCRRLCLGGSFNPIHVGHLIAGRAVAESLGLAGVRLIPSARSPHKIDAADVASASDRLAMCRLAVEGDPFFVVDPIELDRPPPSYTYDTVVALSDGGRVPWVVGTDHLATLHTWHRFDELIERAEFVVMRRAGHRIETSGLDVRVAAIARHAVGVPQVEISATAIRSRIREGRPIDYFVPPAVARFIAERRTYLATDRGS